VPDANPTVPVLRGDLEVPRDGLVGKTVAILGYGNQGRAHAANLADSFGRTLTLVIGGRPGSDGLARASEDGLTALPNEEAAALADLAIVALPDEIHGLACPKVLQGMRPGATVGFIHGFSIRFGAVTPREDLGVVLVAPKGPGTTLRSRFRLGQGIPALLAVERESSRGDARRLALAWANGIGSARAGVLETTFAAEAETDLFGEQAVLCGGLQGLIVAAFETLVEAGYPPELAYIECCHEAKQVADLVYAGGLDFMRRKISNTAEFGAHAAAPRIADERVRATFRQLLAEIRDGSFAKRFLDDTAAGGPWMEARRAEGSAHPIEESGRSVRSLMPWLADEAAPGGPGR
jgi:ketol-acid reductoisomerase